MKNSTLELQDELDSYDVDNSLAAVAAYSELKDLKSYKDIITRKHNISSLAAAKLTSEQQLRAAEFLGGDTKRTVGVGSTVQAKTGNPLQQGLSDLLAFILIGMDQDDEGYEDVNIVKIKNDRKEIT